MFSLLTSTVVVRFISDDGSTHEPLYIRTYTPLLPVIPHHALTPSLLSLPPPSLVPLRRALQVFKPAVGDRFLQECTGQVSARPSVCSLRGVGDPPSVSSIRAVGSLVPDSLRAGDGGQRQVSVLSPDGPTPGVCTPHVAMVTPGSRPQHLQTSLSAQVRGYRGHSPESTPAGAPPPESPATLQPGRRSRSPDGNDPLHGSRRVAAIGGDSVWAAPTGRNLGSWAYVHECTLRALQGPPDGGALPDILQGSSHAERGLPDAPLVRPQPARRASMRLSAALSPPPQPDTVPVVPAPVVRRSGRARQARRGDAGPG